MQRNCLLISKFKEIVAEMRGLRWELEANSNDEHFWDNIHVHCTHSFEFNFILFSLLCGCILNCREKEEISMTNQPDREERGSTEKVDNNSVMSYTSDISIFSRPYCRCLGWCGVAGFGSHFLCISFLFMISRFFPLCVPFDFVLFCFCFIFLQVCMSDCECDSESI